MKKAASRHVRDVGRYGRDAWDGAWLGPFFGFWMQTAVIDPEFTAVCIQNAVWVGRLRGESTKKNRKLR